MPATRTRAQWPYVSYAYSSSSSESSILDPRTPFPYIRIPKISLLDYGQLLSDEENFDEVMPTIGHRQSLVNQSKTIRHLWLTSRGLLEEVDRQRHEAWVIFTWIERMGLQQELYGSRFTASPVQGRLEWSTSPLSSQLSASPVSSLSQFHSCEETVINDDLSDYHESEDPLASLLSLPLPPSGTIGNAIVVSDDEDDIDSLFSHPSYHEARSTFTTPTLQLLHCWDCTNRRHFYFDCPQYICDHCLMHTPYHRKSDCPNRWSQWLQSKWGIMLQTIRLFFSSLTCVCLMPFIFTYLNTSLPTGTHESLNTCVYLMVNMPLPCIYNMSNMQFTHVYFTLLILFKPVVSGCISLASH
jgi:hypothetical protein